MSESNNYAMGLLQTIKKAAKEAVEADKPCTWVYGTVISIETDTTELIIKLSDKLELTDFFLVFGQNIRKENLKIDDKLILLQQAGGQHFYVMDKVGDENASV